MKTLCVLTNWKRPQNVMECVDAWRPQVDRLVVVDNAPFNPNPANENVPYPFELYSKYAADESNGLYDVWRWTENSGPPCRWAPALIDGHNFDYVVFADDDLIPVPDAVSKMLNRARVMDNAFSTIGTEGRDFRQSYMDKKYYTYKYGNAPGPVVDLTVRMHFVRASLLYLALAYRTHLCERFGDEARKLCSVHDDFLLCHGIRYKTRFPSMIIPGLIAKNLDDKEGAVHRRPGHIEERQKMVDYWCQMRGAK